MLASLLIGLLVSTVFTFYRLKFLEKRPGQEVPSLVLTVPLMIVLAIVLFPLIGVGAAIAWSAAGVAGMYGGIGLVLLIPQR